MQIKTIKEIMIPLDQYPYVNHRATLRETIGAFHLSQLEDMDDMKFLPRMLLVFDDINQLTSGKFFKAGIPASIMLMAVIWPCMGMPITTMAGQ